QPHQRARSAEVIWRDRLESSKGVRIVEFEGKLDQEAHAILTRCPFVPCAASTQCALSSRPSAKRESRDPSRRQNAGRDGSRLSLRSAGMTPQGNAAMRFDKERSGPLQSRTATRRLVPDSPPQASPGRPSI